MPVDILGIKISMIEIHLYISDMEFYFAYKHIHIVIKRLQIVIQFKVRQLMFKGVYSLNKCAQLFLRILGACIGWKREKRKNKGE